VGGNWQRQTFDANSDDYAPQFVGETNFKQGLLAPFIGAPRSSFGTVFHNNKLYMIGGHQGAEHTYPPESFSNIVVVYDVKTNKWTELAPRPHLAHGYQVVANGNYIYAFGGFTYSEEHKPKWKSIDAVDRYDIAKNEWTTIARLTTPRSSNQSIVVGNKVYLVGGWDSTPLKPNDYEGTFLSHIDIFDLETETVSEAPYKMPLPLRRAFTAVEYNGKMLLMGGLGQGSSHFELISKLTLIDPVTGAAEELTEMPFATFAPAAGIIGDELYAFGGMFKTGEMNYEYVSHIYAFNFKTKQWRHTGRYVNETKGFSQVFNIDDKTLGILGGHHYYQGFDLPVTTFETFSK
jgi:N-acetylneuraminic acid mutarotase